MNKKHWVEVSHLLPTRRGAHFGGEPYFEMIFFFNLADWFLVELRTAIYVFRRTFSATFFWKSVFCFDSRTFSKNLVRNFAKCFRQFFQNWHPSVQMNKLRRQVFYGKIKKRLAKVVSTSLSKMTFTRPEKLFEENNFLKTFTKVTCFWFWAKNVWQDAQTAFTCPVQQCWKVEPRGENQSFLSFPHIMWNSFATSKEIGMVVKLAFIISSGTFWEKNRLKETVFRFSPCFDFEQKTLVRVVTPSSSASKGTFWKKKYFRTIIFFSIWVNDFW